MRTATPPRPRRQSLSASTSRPSAVRRPTLRTRTTSLRTSPSLSRTTGPRSRAPHLASASLPQLALAPNRTALNRRPPRTTTALPPSRASSRRSLQRPNGRPDFARPVTVRCVDARVRTFPPRPTQARCGVHASAGSKPASGAGHKRPQPTAARPSSLHSISSDRNSIFYFFP